jgi:hypothetical protein
MEIIQELIQFRNKYPRLYDLAEKEYMEANEDVAVNPHGHIVIEELTSYHAVRFMKLLETYILDELERFDD